MSTPVRAMLCTEPGMLPWLEKGAWCALRVGRLGRPCNREAAVLLRLSRQLAAVRRQSASVWGTLNPGGQRDRKTRTFLHEGIPRPAAHPHAFSAFASPAGKARAMRMGCDENWPQWEWAAMIHDLIPTGRQWSAQAVRGDAAARRLAPISGASTSTPP